MIYVIVGNSYAGISAAEAIREVDKTGDVVMVSDEPYRAYARPLISYCLSGRVKRGDIYLRPVNFYRKNNIDLFLNRRADSVNAKDKALYFGDGTSLRYDRLLISTGGRSFIPKIDGIDTRGVFSFTHLSDALKMKMYALNAKRAIVLGGGLIGLKAAEGLYHMGIDVHIIVRGQRLLSLILDREPSGIVKRHVEDLGVKLTMGRDVVSIFSDGDGRVSGVLLDNGRRYRCDVLVIAKGIRPNLDLIRNTPVTINRGIVVDRHMRTSVEGIYAAGDVAEAWDILSNRNSVIAILPLANEQGRVAGYNMAGRSIKYAGGISMNSIEIFGYPIMTLGITNNLNPEHEVRTYKRGKTYKSLIFSENRLIGAVLMGDVDYGGAITNLIRSRSPMGDIRSELLEKGLRSGDLRPKLLGIFNSTVNRSLTYRH